jgi:4-hydroxy-tetrahydrodipicolinate synthase
LAAALKLQDLIDPVVDTIYQETNPGPLKVYMALAGMPVGAARLPLAAPGAALTEKLKIAAQNAKASGLA